MYKTEVIRRVAKGTRLPQRVVGEALDATFKAIQQTLREGKTVIFPGFGTFYTSQRQEGQARDFRTGETISYPARRVASFRAGAILKRAARAERAR
jgi:DNA-binding protein HU-beta